MIVLYAFVLQGFLGGLVPVGMLDAAGYLCSEPAMTAPGEAPVKVPAKHPASCCTAAHVAVDAGVPPAEAVAIAWPLGGAEAATHRPELPVAARAPPGSRFLARGPPAA